MRRAVRASPGVVEWMAATGQVRLMRRLPTFLPPEVAADPEGVELMLLFPALRKGEHLGRCVQCARP
ncbi:MAG: hypothetical protein ACRDRH_16140 [Pseudonocardia sp.]